MKKLLVIAIATLTTSAFAQFTRPGIPANGLSINCRTVSDVVPADYGKDGRLYISASIFNDQALEKVTFKIGQASTFTSAYKSKTQDLKITSQEMMDQTIKSIEGYRDAKFSFSITQFPMDFEDLANRLDTFSALVGIVENPARGGFAKNYELRCVVKQK